MSIQNCLKNECISLKEKFTMTSVKHNMMNIQKKYIHVRHFTRYFRQEKLIRNI
jgi:hypothetical protein